ncbi:MAG: hypothetical protein R3199_11940 [Gemmatimonadota bacterium]|nr:hypothetical protein [Gemmatimonadota bacterium]
MMGRLRIPLPLLAAAALLLFAGCDGETAPSEMSLRVRAEPLPGPFAGLTVEVRTSAGVRTFAMPGDFDVERTVATAGPFPVPSSGRATVAFVLEPGGVRISSGEVSFPMRPDFRWGVDFFRLQDDPARLCFGCQGSESFPILFEARRNPEESVWITWGGVEEGAVAATTPETP